MSDEEKKIMEEFEKQINEEKKIVEALNSLNEKALKNYYPKLEIQQKNKFIIVFLIYSKTIIIFPILFQKF